MGRVASVDAQKLKRSKQIGAMARLLLVEEKERCFQTYREGTAPSYNILYLDLCEETFLEYVDVGTDVALALRGCNCKWRRTRCHVNSQLGIHYGVLTLVLILKPGTRSLSPARALLTGLDELGEEAMNEESTPH